MARLTHILIAWLLASATVQAQDLSALEQAAKKGRRDADAQSAYGHALVEAAQYRKAERFLKLAARLRKDDARGLYDRVAIPLAQGDYRRSKGACRELQNKHPDSVLGDVCMARAFLAWRRASRADEHLTLAAKKAPQDLELQIATADARRMQGRTADALAAYQAVLQASPTLGRAHVGLGLLHLASGDRGSATAALQTAITHSPYNVRALHELGQLLEGKEAVAMLERALALKKKWPEAKLALAQAKLEAGDVEAAEALFRVALKDKRFTARAQIGLGTALMARGDLVAAEEGLKAGLSALPHSPEANFALAQLYERTERYEDAFEQYRAAAVTRGHNTRALMAAAQLAVKLSRNLLAGAFLRKALENAPKAGGVHALYADLLVARGDREAAKNHYQQALAGEGEVDRDAVAGKLAALK